jgi:pimeloyl-ACP methyl ester carboxylesterase
MASQNRTRRGFLYQAAAGTAALSAQSSISVSQSSMSPTTSGLLPRPGAEIYYEVTGSGPAVVFAHGLGGNHLSWWQQVPHFALHHTCITFAHRGFAPSRLSAGAPDPTSYVDDLAGLIDHLKLKEVSLVAQSMGGWSCLEYTLRHPEQVRALVMAATGGTVDLNTLDAPDKEKLEKWNAAHRGAEEDLFRRGIHPAAGERMAREQPALQFLYREIDQLSSVDKTALRAKLGAMRTLPVSKLKSMRTRVLFISGTEDIVFPPPAAAALAAVIPGAKLERVPEAGHSVYFERAAKFNEVVSSFLASA